MDLKDITNQRRPALVPADVSLSREDEQAIRLRIENFMPQNSDISRNQTPQKQSTCQPSTVQRSNLKRKASLATDYHHDDIIDEIRNQKEAESEQELIGNSQKSKPMEECKGDKNVEHDTITRIDQFDPIFEISPKTITANVLKSRKDLGFKAE